MRSAALGRAEGVVPFWVPVVVVPDPGVVEFGHLCVGDLDAGRVGVGVEFGVDGQVFRFDQSCRPRRRCSGLLARARLVGPSRSRRGSSGLVLERQLKLRAVQQCPRVTDDNVLLGHLGHSKITYRRSGRADGLRCCFLP